MRITLADLKTRLHIAKEVLKDKDYNAQVMTCGRCGSTYIEKIVDNRNAIHHRAQFVCKNCGCYCVESQEWNTGKE